MDDLRRLFLKETAATAAAAERLVSAPHPNPRTLGGAVREMHAVRGMCGLLNLPRVGALSAAAEAALSAVRAGPDEPALRRAIQAACRRMAELAEASAGREPEGSDGDVIAALRVMRELAVAMETWSRDPAAPPPLTGPEETEPQAWSLSAAVAHLDDYARDLAEAAGKVVEVRLQAPPVRVETAVIAALLPTLAQLIRNAIAHGIETAPERLAAGKPAAGTLSITARRVNSRRVDDRLEVEVADDGRGLDPALVAAAAVRVGHISAAEAQRVDLAAAQRLVFLPGISTARAQRRLAGRGVGLDAAAARIALVGGRIAIRSAAGEGTVLTIMLPLAGGRQRPRGRPAEPGAAKRRKADVQSLEVTS